MRGVAVRHHRGTGGADIGKPRELRKDVVVDIRRPSARANIDRPAGAGPHGTRVENRVVEDVHRDRESRNHTGRIGWLELDAPSTPSTPTATVESNVDDEVVPLPVFTNDPYSEHDPIPHLIHDHVVVDAVVRDGVVAPHFTVVDVDRSSRGIPVEVTPPDFSIRLHEGRLHRAATIEVDNVIQTVERGGIAAVGELVAEDEEV